MRIIAGTAKGTRLEAPPEGTRPMTGRARESLFSILAMRLPGARVLDLYAGSGSLGLEALSRGASEAVFVERSRRAIKALERNIEAVGLGGAVIVGSLPEAIGRLRDPFDLVFVDPPYAKSNDAVGIVLEALTPVVAPGAIVVLHRRAGSEVDPPDFLTSKDERRYGDAVVTMMERVES